MRGVLTTLLGLINACLIISSCTSVKAETPVPSSTHVIIIGLDGWSSESFNKADIPFIKGLLPRASWSLHKRSVLPTSSAVNWATMFMGAGPEAHGYTEWDTKKPVFSQIEQTSDGFFPTIFSQYRAVSPNTEFGYMYQWDGMRYVVDNRVFNTIKVFDLSEGGTNDMAEQAIHYVVEKRPAIAAFIWDFPDHVGHAEGWMSESYLKNLNYLDGIIKKIVETCADNGIDDSNTLFIITSDHGGHDKTHGAPQMSDLETPFIMFGNGVTRGYEITDPLLQYDLAAIVADYLHLDHPLSWRGRSPRGVFQQN